MVYDSSGNPWTKEAAYQEGFFSRALLEESGKVDHFGDFAANCPQELRDVGDFAAKMRRAFIDGWKEAANEA